MKKSTVIPLFIAIAVLAVGGWYVFSNSGTSKAAKIAQIASSTEDQIQSYTTSTQELLEYDLKQWQTNEPAVNTENIDIFGLSFDSSWGEPVSVDNRGTIAAITFSNDRSIIITKPSNSSDETQKYLREIGNKMPGSTSSPSQLFEQILDMNYSGYDLMKYILNSKLSDVKNADAVNSAQARSYAVSSRSALARSGQPYEFSTNSTKGFVFESRQQTELWVWANNSQFTITVSNGSDDSVVSEEMVDTLITSLQFTNSQTEQTGESENYFAD